jgi:uncharacterized protein YjiS (DUF1127 family)
MNLSDQARLISVGHPKIVWNIGGWLSQAHALWIARRRRAREMAEISSFSDRDLWDLGLSRSDLQGISDGTYRRDS